LGALPGSPCDTLSTYITEATSTEIKSLRIVPNPNNGIFAVSYQLPQNKAGVLSVYNQLGERVYFVKRPQWSSICPINLSFLPKGIYMVSLESDAARKTTKFVKQ
jgi:hypothetical protein